MTNVTLDPSESQVLALLRQVSPQARQVLFEMLIADLDVDWDEMEEWDGPEVFLDDDQLWLQPLDEPIEGWVATLTSASLAVSSFDRILADR